MKEVKQDIWRHHAAGAWIIIPVNSTVKRDGTAVMGKGLALQAANRYPRLPALLGERIRTENAHVCLFPEYRVITIPVKAHWSDKASLELIERGIQELTFCGLELHEPIVLPRLGCGSGGLRWEDVRPILEQYLDDQYTVVDKS